MNIPLNPIRRVYEEDENADFGYVLVPSHLFSCSVILPLLLGFHCLLLAVCFFSFWKSGRDYEARHFRLEGIGRDITVKLIGDVPLFLKGTGW